jgi:phosphatidate cytidylyltransferase
VALNKAVFKTRALTAVVFVLVMLAGLFINFYSFLCLFLIIMGGCLYEFRKIIKLINPTKYFRLLALSMPYIIIPILMMIELGKKNYQQDLSLANYSPLMPIAIILSIWINDTMAYLVGSFIGKTPFSKISPKKTWEGTGGGVILCVIIMGIIAHFTSAVYSLPLKNWLAIASICAVFGTLGDLLESKIKRIAHIKDSGSFMPGHGGFLDRFDSLLVATPFVWLYVQLFVR